MDTASLKALSLRTLIGSVSLSALFGALAILMGDFGSFEMKILMTSLTISAASLCSLSAGAALEAKRHAVVPSMGIASAAVAALLVVSGVWLEVNETDYWRWAGSATVVAVACSHLSLLGMARLKTRYQWMQLVNHSTVGGLASLVTMLLWDTVEGDLALRVVGVLAVVVGAVTIITPVLHRMSRDESGATHDSTSLAQIDAEMATLRIRLDELAVIRERIESEDRSRIVAG